jgi:hypothetical protein|tara:strand:+ start:249 stop:575 length:327 start_codon:yes stop_codon:yes gene_type:complete
MTTENDLKTLFKVNYIIYEKNDNAVLLDGVVHINNKSYYTSIPLDIVRFTHMCEQIIGLKKTNLIWSLLIKNNDQVSEIMPNDYLGHHMIFSDNSLFINSYLFNLKTA